MKRFQEHQSSPLVCQSASPAHAHRNHQQCDNNNDHNDQPPRQPVVAGGAAEPLQLLRRAVRRRQHLDDVDAVSAASHKAAAARMVTVPTAKEQEHERRANLERVRARVLELTQQIAQAQAQEQAQDHEQAQVMEQVQAQTLPQRLRQALLCEEVQARVLELELELTQARAQAGARRRSIRKLKRNLGMARMWRRMLVLLLEQEESQARVGELQRELEQADQERARVLKFDLVHAQLRVHESFYELLLEEAKEEVRTLQRRPAGTRLRAQYIARQRDRDTARDHVRQQQMKLDQVQAKVRLMLVRREQEASLEEQGMERPAAQDYQALLEQGFDGPVEQQTELANLLAISRAKGARDLTLTAEGNSDASISRFAAALRLRKAQVGHLFADCKTSAGLTQVAAAMVANLEPLHQMSSVRVTCQRGVEGKCLKVSAPAVGAVFAAAALSARPCAASVSGRAGESVLVHGGQGWDHAAADLASSVETIAATMQHVGPAHPHLNLTLTIENCGFGRTDRPVSPTANTVIQATREALDLTNNVFIRFPEKENRN